MQQDIASYYNQTQNHYQRWWKLDTHMALHYGLWIDDCKNFAEALHNTNKYMAALANIKSSDLILDAGCGVGGSSIYLAKNFQSTVSGVSLSDLQVETATKNALKEGLEKSTNFSIQDYTDTSFSDASFDVIWACESSSSCLDKQKMLTEWNRILKPGGRLIILDFFKNMNGEKSSTDWLKKWEELWAMSPLIPYEDLQEIIGNSGFEIVDNKNLSKAVSPTVKRMFWSYLLGALPSMAYNLIYRARFYAKYHYKSGLYQYKSFKMKQWEYRSILVKKAS